MITTHLRRPALVLALAFALLVAAPTVSAEATQPTRTEVQQAQQAQQAAQARQAAQAQREAAAACTSTNCPSWTDFRCRYDEYGSFRYLCYMWVRYDYCGGGRMTTVKQYTKMRGEFRILRGTPPGGPGTWAIYPWASRGDRGAVWRQYASGERSATVAVWTTTKPVNKPVMTCTL